MASFKEVLEKIIGEKQSSEVARVSIEEETRRVQPILKQEWVETVSRLKEDAEKLVFPVLKEVGDKIGKAPRISSPIDPSVFDTVFYKRTTKGIERVVHPSTHDRTWREEPIIPFAQVLLDVHSASGSGDWSPSSLSDYRPGEDIVATCQQIGGVTKVTVETKHYETKVVGITEIRNQEELEKLILKAFKLIY